MGVSDLIRGRNNTQLALSVAGSKLPGLNYEVRVSSPNNAGSQNSMVTLNDRHEPQSDSHRKEVTQGARLGIQKAEAAALAWSKKTAYGTYALIWLSFFLLALQSSISTNVIHNAYASFEAAPDISTANILASVISGVMKLPVAKLLNIWGRSEGFLVFIGVYLLGLIILASCNNPSAYAAGYVIYWVGYDAIFLILDVFMADTSSLRNRAFAFGFASTPFICTAFTGPIAAQSFIKTASWRWAYGTFAIIAPFVFLPLAGTFKFYQRKAQRMYIYRREPSGRTTLQSIVHYIKEFDVIGALLLMAAFIFLLLPFSLTTNGNTEYKSATFITMIVIGVCLFFVFAAWERFFAPYHFIYYPLLKDRTILGACSLAAVLFFSYYARELYFYNFCMVVFGLSISMAGYIGQIYNVGSCFWSAVFGIMVYVTKQFKYSCLGFGLPLILLGAGLMIHFRTADSNVGYIVMCQIFIAFGGGTLVIGQDMAVMAASNREGVPMMLSLIGLSSSLGGAVGSAVSAAIYTNTFPRVLRGALPARNKDEYLAIYNGGYVKQLEYPVGSDIHNAIIEAYSAYMKYGCITAVAIMALGIPAIAVWRNYRVDKEQNKGEMISGSIDLPWFLHLDHEDEVVYDISESQQTVKSGTLTGLVEQLTRHDRLDSSFNETFLITFNTFMTAPELFDMLVQRFYIKPPEELDEAEMDQWMEHKQHAIRLRVVNVLRNWLERFWMEPDNEDTRNFLRHAHTLVKDSPEMLATPTSSHLLTVVEQRLQGQQSLRRLIRTPTSSAPAPMVPKNMKKMKLLDLEPVECARQLTILEFGFHGRIKLSECLNKGWQRRGPDNSDPSTAVNAMILHSNQLANWVAETILSQSNMKKRVAMMKYYVNVAEECRAFNNFATLMSIISGLGLTPVYRLQFTWSQVSRRTLATLEDLRQLMSSSRNFVQYRETLRDSEPPCVPFLGIYLTDLTFLEDGIPNHTSTGHINFTKRARTATILHDLQQHQITSYPFQPVPELQDFLTAGIQSAKDVHEMYDRSLDLEPRQHGEEDLPGGSDVGYVATGSHMSSVLIASMVLK
ncbi:hypothetical protein N8T08_000462 [Aspergillus melleus]|uniref:Uncharacterized protein n=1 Tax=Aspergillus melleus TaxID=138277 RepID=A0ACC3BBG8_9EURO|nr:hypothetical protein N8T08_000462 [Aspergillus melleus]